MEPRQPDEDSLYSVEGAAFVIILCVIATLVGLVSHEWWQAFGIVGVYGACYQLARMYDRL